LRGQSLDQALASTGRCHADTAKAARRHSFGPSQAPMRSTAA
jgi:hypothetical protein